ncbi:MAG: ABC transporter ATP-binding protein [Pseudonocardia sp.]
MSTDTELLRAEGLRRSYGQVTALNDTSLTIESGEFVAIVGRSGSGKSTLINLLAGIDHPDEGTVRFRGNPLPSTDEDALAAWRAEHLGLVFQAFHLLPTLDATDNVAIPLLPRRPTAECRELARHRLEQVGLGHRLNHRPSQLSGGEQQRVAIARALINDPDLVLADEPTGNLDSKTGTEILELFEKLRLETRAAIVIVTHDESISRTADRRIRLQDGQVVS